MKYLKKFENLEICTKEAIEERFQHAFDLCLSYSMELGSIDDDKYFWPDSDSDDYLIELEHDFFDTSTLKEFIRFKKILDEVEISLEEIKSAYNPSYIGFIENSNTKISIVIKP